MKIRIALIFATAMLLTIRLAAEPADIAELADKGSASAGGSRLSTPGFNLHGWARANFAALKSDREFNSDFSDPLIGAALQLQLEGNSGNRAHFYSAVNMEYNSYNKESPDDAEVRPYLKMIETYLDFYPVDWLSLRAGHQLVTWGEVEGIEAPTDIVCPWDYDIKTTVFEEYKIGVTALNAAFRMPAGIKADLVWIPVFQPSILPPEEVSNKGAVYNAEPDIVRPDNSLGNGEYAARISGEAGGIRFAGGFMYGYDDLPDTDVYPNFDEGGFNVDLVYDRVKSVTSDLAYDCGDFSVKASGILKVTSDHGGENIYKRNSSMQYLAGIESVNIGFDTYFALYAGQMRVINYSRPEGMYEEAIAEGFDQSFEYRWLLSGVIQRSFLSGDLLEASLRYFLSSSPEADEIDYTVNMNLGYKFTDEVSSTLGFVIADRIGVIRNMVILEMKYAF